MIENNDVENNDVENNEVDMVELEMQNIDMDNVELKKEEKDKEYLKLEECTNEYLNSLTDKQIKDICRREDLRLRGNKNDRIERILKKKQFNINI